MELSDTFKKEKPTDIQTNKELIGALIERDLIREVVLCMHSMKVIQTQAMCFFRNDGGIFEGLYLSHTNDRQMQTIRSSCGDDLFLLLLASRSFGAGVYVTAIQSKYGKAVSDFKKDEVLEVYNALCGTDPYELAIQTLGYAADSNNKKCMDYIVAIGIKAYKAAAKESVMDKSFLKIFMKVMYNAGITFVMRK